VKTVLFVGAGRHQLHAIERTRELGVRVVAVDGSPDAAGLAAADVAEVVDFTDVDAVVEVGRRHRVDGVLTVTADRAVPVVARVAEALGLPGIGSATAHAVKHKVAMRRRLAEAGVPQPPFAAVRNLHEGYAALETVGAPAVLKPADSGGQRGVFRIEARDDLERHLYATLAESAAEEAILEGFVEGTEMNGQLIARRGEVIPLTLSDRLRPPGIGFGVGWIHLYPATIYGDQLEEAERVAIHAVHALGLRDAVVFPQLIAAPDGRVVVVEVAARVGGGQMGDLVRHATGVDLVEVALRQALGEDLPDELVYPRFKQPLAIRFLTAEPGPLTTGRVVRVGSLDRVLAAPGVVQAETYIEPGETIRPVQVDADRRGYVIAVADTNLEALDRAEAASRLIDVDVEPVEDGATSVAVPRPRECDFTIEHYRELLESIRGGGYRFATFDRRPQEGDVLLRHDVDLSLEAALALAEVEAEHDAVATYFVMRQSVFYNLESPTGEYALARLRELGHRIALHALYPSVELDERFDSVIAWHNPEAGHMSDEIDGVVNAMGARFFSPETYRSDSNQHWRFGCPHGALRRREFRWLQLLIHPEIWVYPGLTMRDTMLAFLDDERERRLAQMRADRIDV
jgi:biotin carboxylase